MARTLRTLVALAIIVTLAAAPPVSAVAPDHHSHTPSASVHGAGTDAPKRHELAHHDHVRGHCGVFCVMAPAHHIATTLDAAPADAWGDVFVAALFSVSLELPTPPPRTA